MEVAHKIVVRLSNARHGTLWLVNHARQVPLKARRTDTFAGFFRLYDRQNKQYIYRVVFLRWRLDFGKVVRV